MRKVTEFRSIKVILLSNNHIFIWIILITISAIDTSGDNTKRIVPTAPTRSNEAADSSAAATDLLHAFAASSIWSVKTFVALRRSSSMFPKPSSITHL